MCSRMRKPNANAEKIVTKYARATSFYTESHKIGTNNEEDVTQKETRT